ncbi:MAG: DNA primase [Gammaproteobacteria bacterium]
MASRIPQDFLDQLLNRIDIVELIDSRVSLRKNGRNYAACCPFHNEKTPSFTVSPEKQFYHCFGCGVNGNAIGFLMDYEHLEFRDAVEELARHAGLELPCEADQPSTSSTHADEWRVLALAANFFSQQLRTHPQRQRAIDYLRGRGLDGTTAKIFGLGYAPPGWDSLLLALQQASISPALAVTAGLAISKDNGGAYDRFRDRIMFPIRDRRGRVIGFGGRALDDSTPKYLNSPETALFHKGRELYGLFEARQQQRQPEQLLIVEGYMDVIALAQHGVPYAVATLGTATTSEHLERLFRVTRNLVFCFDGDNAGRTAAWRALQTTLPHLRDGRQVGYLFLPEGEDPDSLIRQEGSAKFQQRMADMLSLSDYFFQQLGTQLNMDSIDGRARLAEVARPLLETIPPGTYRDLMRERLETVIKIPVRLTEPEPARPARPMGLSQVRRTLPRYAISLLLARPALAQQLDANELAVYRQIDMPGLPLLIELIEIFKENPHLTTASILERYRDSETGTILAKLAQAELLLDDALFEAEFFGNMEKIRRLYFDRYLYDKAARGELSAQERELLRRHSQQSLSHRESNPHSLDEK